MKDIYFGCSKQISRLGYLRRNVEHMRKLQQTLPQSKLIVFNNRDNQSKRREVLINSIANQKKLSYLDVHSHEIFQDILHKWLQFNIDIESHVVEKTVIPWSQIDEELKAVSIFWLGQDDSGITTSENVGTSVFSIDISNSDLLYNYITEHVKTAGHSFTNGMPSVLQLSNEDASAYSYSKMFIDFISKNRYCPACGGHIVAVNLGSRLYCLNDSPWDDPARCEANLTSNNLQFPRTDLVVIIALYDSSGRILLGNNKRHPGKIVEKNDETSGKLVKWTSKMYSCFAGFMEPGETIEQACVREVYEETGLELQPQDVKIIESQPWPFPANIMIGCMAILREEETDDRKINVHLDDELEHVSWFDSENVSKVIKGADIGILSKSDTEVEEWFLPSPESVAGRLIGRAVDACSDLRGKF